MCILFSQDKGNIAGDFVQYSVVQHCYNTEMCNNIGPKNSSRE